MKFLERFWFGCGHCHDGDGCPVMDQVDPESGEFRLEIEGPALVGTVIMVFLVPPATAIAGAYLAGRYAAGRLPLSTELCQLGGAVVGFFAGVALAWLVFWTRRRLLSADGGVE